MVGRGEVPFGHSNFSWLIRKTTMSSNEGLFLGCWCQHFFKNALMSGEQ